MSTCCCNVINLYSSSNILMTVWFAFNFGPDYTFFKQRFISKNTAHVTVHLETNFCKAAHTYQILLSTGISRSVMMLLWTEPLGTLLLLFIVTVPDSIVSRLIKLNVPVIWLSLNIVYNKNKWIVKTTLCDFLWLKWLLVKDEEG